MATRSNCDISIESHSRSGMTKLDHLEYQNRIMEQYNENIQSNGTTTTISMPNSVMIGRGSSNKQDPPECYTFSI